MAKNIIEEKIFDEIRRISKIENIEISRDLHLEYDLGIDSLLKVELASNLLDIFDLNDISIEEIPQWETVGQIVNFIETLF